MQTSPQLSPAFAGEPLSINGVPVDELPVNDMATAAATADRPCMPTSTVAVADAAPHPSKCISSPHESPPPSFFDSISAGGATTTRRQSASSTSNKMLFSDLYQSSKSPLSRLRQHSQPMPVSPTSPDYEADLVSKDKTRQKEAVKKFLAARIRSDWEFKWPRPKDEESLYAAASSHNGLATPPLEQPATREAVNLNVVRSASDDELEVEEDNSSDDDAASTYSTVSEDAAHWRPRLESLSDVSEVSDDDPPVSPSAYRFDGPDVVGNSVRATRLARSARHRRAVRSEAAWNTGLACFNARRDAWTGAKTARVRSKPPSTPASPTPPGARRLSFWRISTPASPPTSPQNSAPLASPLTPVATQTSGETTAVSSSDAESKEIPPKPDPALLPVKTLLPIVPPLLPLANPMRASITPASYPSIYDKIIVQSMTPACPVNLSDVLRSCVTGWKRDGEWPPRSADMATSVVAVRKKKRESVGHVSTPSAGRRMSFVGFLGRRESNATGENAPGGTEQNGVDSNAGKGIRRSLQKVLGLGHERSNSNASNNGTAA